jgi:hypothetical protein
LAQEITRTYKARQTATKQDPRLKEVVEEVEGNCLPPQP